MEHRESGKRLAEIRARIASAATSAGRDPAEITLIAVSKTYPVDRIRTMYELGVRDFGESKLQEAIPKIAALPHDIHWHFIGHLQSNKVRAVAQSFGTIHTLSTESALRELHKAPKMPNVFTEVNSAAEPQKSGLLPAEVEAFVGRLREMPSVRWMGLMTMGPATDDLSTTLRYFRETSHLNAALGGKSLSMGMSADFECAIQEGATHVRVGSALFGPRG
ncbi:MAG: YggS family pyridoxal phosphate-dependent enzyme [Fimbriimonadaceae bacterium]|nr:YggS family pyridoxal phosphate-dependent enzyme [Fimbriimonadaceae bacterium]